MYGNEEIPSFYADSVFPIHHLGYGSSGKSACQIEPYRHELRTEGLVA
jgi:hypothetical protein